jgi:hypothetical protein
MPVIKNLLQVVDRDYAKGMLTLVYHLGVNWKTLHLGKMFKNPIIIGGCGRSGTGLLLSLLSVHPNIYSIRDETKAFCPGAYSRGEFPDTLNEVEEYSPNPVNPDEARFYPDFVVSHLLEDLNEALKADRWCEKSPKNILFAQQILEYFGKEASFLHIVRDGRNVVTSRHPGSPENYYVPPERWVRDVSAARKVEDHSQLYTVRYENLTGAPKDTLRNVFDFLDEPFPERALRAYPQSSQFSDNEDWLHRGRRKKILDGIRSPNHERHQKPEHEDRVETLMSIPEARALMSFYGYT